MLLGINLIISIFFLWFTLSTSLSCDLYEDRTNKGPLPFYTWEVVLYLVLYSIPVVNIITFIVFLIGVARDFRVYKSIKYLDYDTYYIITHRTLRGRLLEKFIVLHKENKLWYNKNLANCFTKKK